MKKPSWDTEAGRQMWAEGKTDSEIADTFGISTGAVTSFRLKHWGGGNGTRGGRAPKKPNLEGKEETPVKKESICVPTEAPAEKMDVFDVLEAATSELKGIQAICTANAIKSLWNWSSKEDLKNARESINYLLKKLGEEIESR